MKTERLLAVIALVLGLSLTSCLGHSDNEDAMKVTYTYPGYFNEIIDESTGEIFYYSGISYNVEFNIAKSTCTLQLEGLKLPDGTSYPTLQFTDVPWTVNSSSWNEIYLTNYTPEGVGSYNQGPTFDAFLFQTLSRYITTYFVPLVDVSYRIGDYLIYSLPTEIIETGDIEIINREDGSVYEPQDSSNPTLYYFQLDTTTRKAKITIIGAQFHKDMPSMNIRFSDVPFETSTRGDILFSCESLTPSLLTGDNSSTATEVPMETIQIKNLSVTYDPDGGIWVSYNCQLNMPKFTGDYDVTMINKFPVETE